MSYRIAFLDDKDFEQLPGRNMGTKIGVAYPKYGEAYVRKTGSNLVDVFTLAHELEHLQGATHNEHYDSDNECYYKSGFMDSLSPLYGATQGNFGPLLSTVGSMFGMPMLGNLFGGSPKQQQQSPMNQFSTPMPSGAEATAGMGMPNVIQGQGAGAGAGLGGGAPSIGKGVAGVGQAMQNQDITNQRYGTQAGRDPLMGGSY